MRGDLGSDRKDEPVYPDEPWYRPARRFDEPPAYEDLELRCDPENGWHYISGGYVRGHFHPAGDPELARHSHLGAIVIVAAIVGLALIAVALFLRGAS